MAFWSRHCKNCPFEAMSGSGWETLRGLLVANTGYLFLEMPRKARASRSLSCESAFTRVIGNSNIHNWYHGSILGGGE